MTTLEISAPVISDLTTTAPIALQYDPGSFWEPPKQSDIEAKPIYEGSNELDFVDNLSGKYGTINAYGGHNYILSHGENIKATSGKGNDVFEMTGGDQFIHSYDGINHASTGKGNDIIRFRGGRNTIFSGRGKDLVIVRGIHNVADLGFGDDQIKCEGGRNTALAKAGNDFITGLNYAGKNSFYGGKGNDRLVGGLGSNKLNGGPGADILFGGGKESNIYNGGSGADIFILSNYEVQARNYKIIDFNAKEGDQIFFVSEWNAVEQAMAQSKSKHINQAISEQIANYQEIEQWQEDMEDVMSNVGKGISTLTKMLANRFEVTQKIIDTPFD